MTNALNEFLTIVDKPEHEQVAIRRALELQKLSGARLELLAFVNETLSGRPAELRRQKETLMQQREKWLESQLARRPHDSEQVTSHTIWTRDIAGSVKDQAASAQVGLVLKAAHHSKSPLHTPLDWELIRTCPKPLMICSTVAQKNRKNLLVSLDLTRDTAAHRRLNTRVLDAAHTYADLYGLKVHCVYVVAYSEVLADLDMINVATNHAAMKREVLPRMRELVEPYGIPNARLHVPTGPVGRTVNQVASKIQARFLVVGTTAKRALRAVFVGDSATRVLNRCRRDLIVVKP